MKKIFMVIALMAMLMLPFTSFSMTAMEDGDLSSVTGQAGVSINLDATVDLTATVVAWGDADGFGATGDITDNAGWVGLTGLNITDLRVRADQTLLGAEWYAKHSGTVKAATFSAKALALQTAASDLVTEYATLISDTTVTLNDTLLFASANPGSLTKYPAFGTAKTEFDAAKAAVYADAGASVEGAAAYLQVASDKGAGEMTPFAPLTIDVATGGAHGAGITFVRIGLGSLQVEMDSMIADAELGPTAANIPNMKYTLGSLYLDTLSLRVGGDSYVDIYNDRSTGQGVSLAVNATIRNFSIDTLAWGDTDGIDWAFSTDTTTGVYGVHSTDTTLQTTADAAVTGWVGLKNLDIAKITAAGDLTIDVATNAAGWTYVEIGFGTGMVAGISGLTATAALGNDVATTGLDQELGSVYVSGATATLTGSLQLGARSDGTQGVTIDLGNLNIAISQGLVVSWGDDNLDLIGGAGETAGYVGLKNLNLTGLDLAGKVTIDVATVDTTVTTLTATTITEMMYAGYVENNLSPSIVHIGLDNVVVTVGGLSADVVFSNNAPLAGLTAAIPTDKVSTMGSLYVNNLVISVDGWVDIAAH